MKPYFYVQRVGDRPATVKHTTLESAHKESLRLAGQHPGASFEILQCLGITRTTEPNTFWNDGCDPATEESPVADWALNIGREPYPHNAAVEVMFRDGTTHKGQPKTYRWNVEGFPDDITHWRFVQ